MSIAEIRLTPSIMAKVDAGHTGGSAGPADSRAMPARAAWPDPRAQEQR